VISPYLKSIIVYLCVYYPNNSLSNSCCSKLDSYIIVTMYGSSGPPILLMKLISSSECITLVYEDSTLLRDRTIRLPFNTWWIPTMNIVFSNTERLPHPLLTLYTPKSIPGYLLPWLSCVLTFLNLTFSLLQIHHHPLPTIPFRIIQIATWQPTLTCQQNICNHSVPVQEPIMKQIQLYQAPDNHPMLLLE
jgi:hypothetical protein